jgi:hypothetical protein
MEPTPGREPTMDSDSVREHMKFERHSAGHKIIIDIQNVWDENARLSRGLPDLSDRISENIRRVCDRHDLNLAEWHYWCKQARA